MTCSPILRPSTLKRSDCPDCARHHSVCGVSGRGALRQVGGEGEVRSDLARRSEDLLEIELDDAVVGDEEAADRHVRAERPRHHALVAPQGP
jgi:hypothetical protein